jgi:tetratricopeptide (TPR) repeat protein
MISCLVVLTSLGGCGLIERNRTPDDGEAIGPTHVGPTRAQELDILFDRLAAAPDAGSAQELESRIWTHWMQSGSATTDILMERGAQAEQAGDLVTAKGFFDRAAAISPGYAEAWNRRATIAFRQDEYSEALKDIEATLRAEPRHFSALVGLGLIFEATDRKQAALRAFRDALLVHPYFEEAQRGVDRLAPVVEGRDI